MSEISSEETASYLELVLDAYFDEADPSGTERFALEKHLELLQEVKGFVVKWKQAALPSGEMNKGFRNKMIREIILAGVTLLQGDLEKLHREWEEILQRPPLPRL